MQVLSSSKFNTDKSAVLRVGDYSTTFTVTTELDNIASPFSFKDANNVALNSTVTSNMTVVQGLGIAVPISIVGGEYSINGGAFTSAAGTVSNLNRVQVRTVSSVDYATTETVILDIGGVVGSFEVTTKEDIDPNVFDFAPVTNVSRSSWTDSDVVTIGGLGVPAVISVKGGEYSINGGAFTSVAGTVTNGDEVQVQVLSSSKFNTGKSAVLRVGDYSTTFTVTTELDNIASPFSFKDVNGVKPGTSVASDYVLIHGIQTPVPVSVSGGEFRINQGSWRVLPTTVKPYDRVQVRVLASNDFLTSTHVTLTVGDLSDTFTVTTSDDIYPDPFIFANQQDWPLESWAESNVITIGGITAPSPVSISSLLIPVRYSIDGGAFTSAPGFISNGQTLQLSVLSSSVYQGVHTAQITVGDYTTSFTVKSEGFRLNQEGYGWVGSQQNRSTAGVVKGETELFGAWYYLGILGLLVAFFRRKYR